MRGGSPATVSFYRRNRNHFVRETGVAAFEEVTPAVVRDWWRALSGATSTTLAAYDRRLRVTYGSFEIRGCVPSPLKRLQRRRTRRTVIVARDLRGVEGRVVSR